MTLEAGQILSVQVKMLMVYEQYLLCCVSQDILEKDLQACCSLLTPAGISQQKGFYKEASLCYSLHEGQSCYTLGLFADLDS